MAISLIPDARFHKRVPTVGEALGWAGWTDDWIEDPTTGDVEWGGRLEGVAVPYLQRETCAERVGSDDLNVLDDLAAWMGPTTVAQLFDLGLAPIGYLGESVLYGSLIGTTALVKRGDEVWVIAPPGEGRGQVTLADDEGWSTLSPLRSRLLLWARLLQREWALDDLPLVRVGRVEVSELVDGTVITRALLRQKLAAARYLMATYGGEVLDRMAEGLLPIVRDRDLVLLGGDRAVCLTYVHGYGIEVAHSVDRRSELDPWAVHALRQLRTVDSVRWGGNDKHYEPPCEWEELARAVMALNDVPTGDLDMKDVA